MEMKYLKDNITDKLFPWKLLVHQIVLLNHVNTFKNQETYNLFFKMIFILPTYIPR